MHKHDGVQTDQELTQLTGDLLYELGAWLWAIGLPRPSPHVAFGIGAGTMCVNHCTWASMFCFHVLRRSCLACAKLHVAHAVIQPGIAGLQIQSLGWQQHP